MLHSTRRQFVRNMIHLLPVILLFVLVCIEFAPLTTTPRVNAQSHSYDRTCQHVSYSPDGNPFPLCPASYPAGGNCTWWAWEQWHLLGYNLPLNWGNAADWLIDAERTGLPVGTTPRVGAIAVFPRADGVWAYGPPGHVAFVTRVNADDSTFDVTYQNYGDPTPMYVGKDYNVSLINTPRYQNGQLGFIYFPQTLDIQRFEHLSGVDKADAAAIVLTNNHILQPSSSEQEFNADFTGAGFADLLLYNRQQGSLYALALQNPQSPASNSSLGDAITPPNQWGSSLDVHIGAFAGTGESDILLYDRIAGTIQILSLTPQLTIKNHVVLSGWGPNWEMYVGRFDGQHSSIFMYKRFAEPTSTSGSAGRDLSGSALADWEKQGRTANILVVDFNKDFSIRDQQQYTLWHANWEVYVGRFVNPTQDGIFLYDRSIGEGRIMDFDSTMLVSDYQQIHNLDGNWLVYSGDFIGTSRAQLLLYDPGSGNAQMLTFMQNLILANQQTYSGWGTNMVPYIGHFGLPTLSVMLYEPQKAHSTFITFDQSLQVRDQYTVSSWGPRWQILIGAFLDRSSCLKVGNCSTGDDILLLDRQTGQIEQYAFAFGRKLFDNRVESFIRDGIASDLRLKSADTTTFSLLTTLDTSIRNEELY